MAAGRRQPHRPGAARALHPDQSRRVGTAAVSKAGQRGAGNRRSASSEAGLNAIAVRGARQHNLKGIDLDIPRDQMTVCSGPSGSGKSSLAIDTLYAEGQRRYVESLSSYARQFLAPLQKPKVERITGSRRRSASSRRRPARARARRSARSPRSTTTCASCSPGWAIRTAPSCGMPIGTQTADEIVEKVLHLPEGTKVYVMAPVERRDGETLRGALGRAAGLGLRPGAGRRPVGRAWTSPPKLSHRRKHKIEVVVDRAVVRRSTRSRLADSIESALDLGKGVVHVARVGDDAKRAELARRPLQPAPRLATAAAAASTSWRRTTSRSTARWAGARSARGWASSTAPTRRCSCPTAG